MALPFINDTVGDLLNNYVKFITKQMQEIADAVFGAENDNDNQSIPLPVSVQTRGFIGQEAADLGLSFQPLTDAGFYGWDYYYGRMNGLYSVDISYVNGNLTIGTPVYVGKYNVDGHNWQSLPDGCAPIMLDILNGYVESHAGDYTFTKETYPDKTILPSYYSDWSGTNIRFYQDNNGTPAYNGFKTTFPKSNNTLYTSDTVQIHYYNFLTFANDVYSTVDFGVSRGTAGTYMSQLNDAVLITNTDNQQFINDYITNNNAEHNYTYNYTTSNGDEVTIYYGDNYVITKTDPDAETTYNEYKNALDVVVNKINGDNNYNIKVPTYNDNKYGPEPEPGDWDDMPGAGSSIGALAGARCYICSKTDIINLKNWMSKTEADGGPPDGYDVLSSLISVMAFPVDMTPASSGPAQAISFAGLRTSTDNQLMNIAAALMCLTNQIGATPITETKVFTSTATALPSAGNPFTIDLGTCRCPAFYSSDFPFVDYDASVELYLPFIGTMTLDTQSVMGKMLHAYMTIDPITGAIYSWCECTKNGSRVVVAAGTGAIGVNTPITANQVGMAMAQIKNNAAQSRQSFIQSALTIGMGAFTGVDKNMTSILTKHLTSGNKNIAIAGARDYADALSVGAQQASMMALPNAIGASLNSGRANRQVAQANHNSISGSAGGSTADWSCSYTPYLKIITPDVHDAGEQYEHSYGVPTIQSGTLSSFSGLTFCANPDVSSISTATDQEKQQIFGLLTGGVYV